MRPPLVLLALLAMAGPAAAEDLDHARIAADAEALIALGDRSLGTPGAERAIALIEEHLRASGLEPVRIRTTAAATIDEGSVLTVDGREIRLVPHRTCRAATAGTGGEAVTGPLLFAGKGGLEAFAGRDPRGAIVVLDGDSGAAWTQAAQLGAAAVVFRGIDGIDRRNLTLQGTNVSLAFPRFAAELDPALEGRTATVRSTVRIQPRPAWSVAARIPGTGDHHDAVLLAAGFESPEALAPLSPGTTRAWNAATLLELARSLAASPPRRDTVVVFHGGRGELMRGLRHLTAALTLDRVDGGWDPDGQLSRLHTEFALSAWRETAMAQAFAAVEAEAIAVTDLQQAAVELLRGPPLPDVDTEAQADLLRRRIEEFIALQAGGHADEMLRPLDAMRDAVSPRRRTGMDPDELARRRAAIEVAAKEYDRYRTVQKKLAYAHPLLETDAPLVAGLVRASRAELAHHLAIVCGQRDDFASLLAARTLLPEGCTAIHLIGLDLADGNDRFASFSKGPWVTWDVELGWLHSALAKLSDDLNHQEGEPPVAFERAVHDSQDEVEAWFGTGYVHEAGIAGLYLPGATVATVNDGRLRLGSPADTPARFARDRFLRQVTGLRRFLVAWIDGGFLVDRKPKSLRSAAPRLEVEIASIGTKTGRRGYSYPFALLLREAAGGLAGDVRYEETVFGDAFGICRMPFIPEGHPGFDKLPLQVYGLDDHGRIVAALADAGTQPASADLSFKRDRASDLLPLVFPCVPSRIFDVFDPRLLTPLERVSMLSATRESAPNYFHVETSRELALTAAFTQPGVPLRLTATQGQVGNRLVITGHAARARAGATGDRELAAGLAAGGNLADDTALDTAEDEWRLNETRLALLRRNGINPDSLVSLHSQAESELAHAREAWKARDWAGARAAAQAAWALCGRVYPALLSTANDVVYGLVVMLLFCIPFAWICERLFLAGATVVRKVVGFSVVFVATFLFFFFFHPAFSLATTPMIIFLAFTILIMSSWVIGLVYSKFEHEMELLRMAGQGMHKADVSRLGTLLATVQLGISNMRRRPLRTFLTAATVVLMTFILLTFASFNPGLGSQRIGIDAAPPYNGVLIRQGGWYELPEQVLPRVLHRWGDRFEVHPVRWLAPDQRTPKFPLAADGGHADVTGILGVATGDPTGIEQALVRGDATDPDAPRGFGDGGDWIFLPVEVLARLGIRPGDAVRLRGVTLRAGTIDGGRFGQMQQLGGDPLTPLAYDASDRTRLDETQRLAQLAGDGAPPTESGTALHLGPSAVGVAPLAVVEQLGGRLRAVAMTPRARSLDIAAAAEDVARELALTLRVGAGGETWLLTSVGRMSVAGLGAVLVPLILGGLIIFSTMLNSVAERGKEIFIYASLGLAPIHVAALFLVEASIYAVLGGLGGYMLAQVVVGVLGIAAHFGWGVQPDLNYSSFTAVTTILVVMATVLLSALYPALMASRAASPGTADFTVPDAQDDRIAIPFPFTVAGRDVRGLCAFLVHYLDLHTEAAGGSFTAAEAKMRVDGDRCEVGAKVWLAPFDLGISQRFVMRAVPTDVRSIYSVELGLELLSGQRAAWKRTNMAFLKDLRQQFLVWRTLSAETMDRYRAEGGDTEARARLEAAARPSARLAEAAS